MTITVGTYNISSTPKGIIRDDSPFPDRLRYAAAILREVEQHLGNWGGSYSATKLEDIAAEYEDNQHHHNQEIAELAAHLEAAGITRHDNARQLAENIIAAGWHKTGE
jgi:hypothetical protein